MMWRLLGAALVLTGCESVPPPEPRTQVDTIIVGGLVFDGTGSDGMRADLVLENGRIQFVGPDAGERFAATRTMDVAGLVVAPGFIDPHTHAGSDLSAADALRRANLPFAFQGVTTVVVGNDGFGKPDIAAQAAAASQNGIGTNVAYLAGFGPLREAAMGSDNRAPTDSELDIMRGETLRAMCEGAWGLSAGLYYVPQNYARTEEVVALAKVAAEKGGYYDTHMRDESTYNISVTGALREALDIGRQAGLPVHIAHIKALGPAVWGHSARMIAMIEQAQAGGQRVTADQYPWQASGTRISNALVPRAALEGGLDALRIRLAEPAQALAIREEMVEAIARRGGPEKLLVTAPLHGAEVDAGKTLAELAAEQDAEPVDAAIAILKQGDARVASFNMSEADIRAFASRDWVVTGSDGSSGHPRKYGSFPKAYRNLVKSDIGLSLGRFIRRSSGQTADIIGFTDRGYLKTGYAADIVIFDPEQFAPLATYQSPREHSAGVRHLFVNGEAVISNGSYTGALPGKPLLKETGC